MHWQDWVFSIGNWIFSIALIPAILDKEKPPVSTSLTNTVVLFVMAFTFSTLTLWLSAISIGINGILWFVLAIQKFKQKK